MEASPAAEVPARPAGGWRPWALALATLAIGVAVTLLVWQQSREAAREAANRRFQYRSGTVVAQLNEMLRSDEIVLRSVSGLFGVSGGVNLMQWRSYFDTLETGTSSPGRLWVGFAQRVADGERDAHERQSRNDGLAGYAIRTSEKRAQYFPLAHLRSFGSSDRRPIGLDLQEDPVARAAMARAAATGRLVMAGPLAGIPAPGQSQTAWALFMPVFAHGQSPANESDRQRALSGFVVEAFDAAELAAAALGRDASVIGLGVRSGRQVLFRSTEQVQLESHGWRPSLTQPVEFEFGSQVWHLQLSALPSFVATGADQTWIVLAGGILISALLAGLIGVLAGLRARAMAIAEQRTAALSDAVAQHADSEARLRAIFDHALDGIVTIDAQGTMHSYNPAAESIFGWTESECIGRNVNMLMPSPDHERHDGYLANFLAGGPPKIIGVGRLVTGLRKDGTRFRLDLSVSEMQVGEQRMFCGILRDVTARLVAEDQLRRSERKLRSYIELALDGMIVADEHGHYLEVNPATEKMLGYREDELLDMSIADLVWPDPADQAAGAAHFDRVRKHGNSVGEVALCHKDGRRIIADVHAVDLRDGRFLGIMRDMTERHRAQRALQQERELLEQRVAERTEVLTRTNAELVSAREQALAAADAKASFLANMSHEIRTPMNAVIGMTALLEDTPLDAEQRSYVETIRVSGDALLATINDILDFSKVESGMLELERRPFELGACVEEAFDMLAPRAAEKGIDLLYELMDNVPQWLVGDSTRLRQVLVNLLSNAVKFTDHGEVSLTASVLKRDADSVQLRFAVRDTGIGISAAQREHLFKAFTQADSSTTRKYGGTGLGLAICARLVRLMDGDFRVESEEGKGSEFAFTVHAGVAQNAPTARYRSGHAPELAGRRALLVDDNPTNLQMLKTQCLRWGMEPVCATRGTHALATLEGEGPFDVAVLDLHMPGMDGLHLARAIAAQAGRRAPPLVLLSSSAMRHDPSASDLFAARLAKPVKHSQLFTVLVEVIHGRRPPTATAIAVAQRIDDTVAQRLPMSVLVVEDSAINQKLTVGMLRKFGYTCDVANNGAEALERVAAGRYDLLFMDLQMPVMDGLEATRLIRSSFEAGRQPHIVAMTANAMPADRERCLAAGMDDYIAKPILPAAVQALIERWAPRAEAGLLDEAVLRELAQLSDPGAPSLVNGLLNDYISETPATVSAMKQHVSEADAQALARRAHKLAGTSASLGAVAVAQVCYRIEQHARQGELATMPALMDELEMRFTRTRSALGAMV